MSNYYNIDNPTHMQILVDSGIIWNDASPADYKMQAAEQLASGVTKYTAKAAAHMPAEILAYVNELRNQQGQPPLEQGDQPSDSQTPSSEPTPPPPTPSAGPTAMNQPQSPMATSSQPPSASSTPTGLDSAPETGLPVPNVSSPSAAPAPFAPPTPPTTGQPNE